MKRRLRRLAFVMLSTLVGLLLAEGVVRLFGLGTKGTIGHLYESDAIVGWRHRSYAQTQHESGEFSIQWKFNGERMRREEDLTPKQARSPVLVLGDSHTAGHGVEGHQTYATQLEGLLAEDHGEAQVLNYGVDGYTTSQAWRFVQHHAERWNPRGIVVGIYAGNDVRENLERVGLGGFSRPLFDKGLKLVEPDSKATSQQAIEAEPRSWLTRAKGVLSDSSRLYIFVGNSVKGGRLHRWFADLGLMSPPPSNRIARIVEHCRGGWGQLLWGIDSLVGRPKRLERGLAITSKLIESIQRFCEERGVKFLAVLIPCRVLVEGDGERVREGAEWLELGTDPIDFVKGLRQQLKERLEAQGVAILDPLSTFRDEAGKGQPLYYPEDWHLSPRGHQVLAEAVAKRLHLDKWYP